MNKQPHKINADAENHRISVTFEPEQYDRITQIAEKKRVSFAWVVRDAVEKMLREEIPLFRSDNS